MNDSARGISGSRADASSRKGVSTKGFDPGRKEKRNRDLEELYGLEDRDLPGGIFDDREDH